MSMTEAAEARGRAGENARKTARGFLKEISE